jgi:hypothetical protein
MTQASQRKLTGRRRKGKPRNAGAKKKRRNEKGERIMEAYRDYIIASRMFAFATANDVGQQGNPGLYPVKGNEALITGAARGIGYLAVQNITWQKTKCQSSIFGKRFPSRGK